jgi:hypothetical protein
MRASLTKMLTHFKSIKCIRRLHRFSSHSGLPHLVKGRRVRSAAYTAGWTHHEYQPWKVETVVLKWVFMEGQNARHCDSWTSRSYTMCAFICVWVCVCVCLVWCGHWFWQDVLAWPHYCLENAHLYAVKKQSLSSSWTKLNSCLKWGLNYSAFHTEEVYWNLKFISI